ncbi:MAG: FimV/HubP family polar landmark protein [Steroidobacteraceae bacterium]
MIAKSRVWALALLLLPQLSLALGLGDIHLKSRLNGPLDADIELVGATPEELSTLTAHLASRETFARYALAWPAFMNSVTVTQVKGSDGRTLLHLRSQDPVTEPFVTLLVEVNWARGRLVREYTLLMDPPVFAPDVAPAAAPVAAPTVGEERQGTISRQAPPASAPAAGQPATEPAATADSGAVAPAAAGGSYTVRRGDTLTAIAGNLTDHADTARMMVGLYQANPQAFGDNMSDLHSGAVLRVPDAASLAAIGAGEASAEVRRQYAAWRARAGTPAPSDEHLRLVAPGEAGSGSGAPGAGASAQVERLNDRVRQLEGELKDAKAQLEVRSRELADLQGRLAAAQGTQAPAATTPPAAAEEPPAAAVEAPPPAAEATPPESEPVAAEPVAPEPAPVEAPVRRPAATTAPAEEGPSIFDTLLNFWYIPALLIAALLVLFGVRKWKAREQSDFDSSLGRLAEAGAEIAERRSGITDTARLRKPMGGDEDESFLVEESGPHERPRVDESGTFRKPPAVVSTPADQTISGETAINLDQGDPLAEADFHMAYGLYDQAADLVRIAIQREPARRDLKLKLLEVFFVWGNKEQFLATARELAASRADAPAGEWDKIVIMGKQLAPEDELFQQATPAGGAIAGGIDLDLEGGQNRVDYDLLGDPGGESPRADTAGVDLDFSTALGSDALGDKDPTGEAGAIATATAAGDDLDFVLDDPARGAEDRSGNTTREMTAQMPHEPTVEQTAMMPDAMDAPTVEQPTLRIGGDHTLRQKVDVALRQSGGADPTAELALDDLGLDVGALDASQAASDAPTMVAGLDARSREIIEEAERRANDDTGEAAATGSWYTIDSTDQTGSNPAIADVNATASLKALKGVDVDFGATDAFGTRSEVDLDVGTAADNDGAFAATQKIGPEDLALPDLEPVTMSEVGTKLDLARAYMDMGDPDGARSILKEVLQEGSVSQKQEAQRLIDTLPG